MPPSSRFTDTAKAQKGLRAKAIGRSKGGMTTKILALTEALGNLVRFQPMPGNRFDRVGDAPLIEDVEFGALLANRAFDSNDIIAELNARGAKIVISQHPRRAIPRLQNKPKLRGHDLPRRSRHQLTMNPHRP